MEDRKPVKHDGVLSNFIFYGMLLTIIFGVSAIEYRYFNFAEPWMRVVGILASWFLMLGALYSALLPKSRNWE